MGGSRESVLPLAIFSVFCDGLMRDFRKEEMIGRALASPTTQSRAASRRPRITMRKGNKSSAACRSGGVWFGRKLHRGGQEGLPNGNPCPIRFQTHFASKFFLVLPHEFIRP